MRDKILYEIQKNFPLVERPFKEIGERLSVDENEVIDIVNEERSSGIIRQISAIFDTKKLGYKSSLVAFKIKKNDIDRAVEILNSHPGISHNYERDHDFNIWFTIAISPDSIFGLEKTVDMLASLTEADEYIILPTVKLFKIAVKLDTTSKAAKKEKIKKRSFKDIELTDLHKKIIKLSQENIEITQEPFKKIIKEADISYDSFFAILKELKDAGVMRRFAAILNHRKAGFNANAMVVWDIDDDEAVKAGEKIASFSAVSHCYLRPKYPNWPYNLFSMIHAKTKEESDAIIKEMEKEVKFNSNRYLYSSREFKKIRIKYYSDEFIKWEKNIKERFGKEI